MVCKFWSPDYRRERDLYLIVEEEAEAIAQGIRDTSKSQLRNFYGEVKMLERKLRSKKYDWRAEILPSLKLLKAKVKYASARGNVRREFVEFMEKSINKVNTPDDFYDFCLIFEAVVGYHYRISNKK